MPKRKSKQRWPSLDDDQEDPSFDDVDEALYSDDDADDQDSPGPTRFTFDGESIASTRGSELISDEPVPFNHERWRADLEARSLQRKLMRERDISKGILRGERFEPNID